MHRNGTLYDRNGYDAQGYGVDGYDYEGYDRRGFNREKLHRNGTLYDASGFDGDGFDSQGYGWDGYDRQGFNRDGYGRDGYDRTGYDAHGYDRDGYGRDGYNRQGFNLNGYDRDGYDRDGYDRDGYDRDGYDRDGYGRDGYDRDGYNRRGFNREKLHRNGTSYDSDGFDIDGFDRDGYNRNGYDRQGYNRDGYDRDGYDHDGYGCDGYDRCGYDRDGYDRRGYDRRGYDIRGFDLEGFDTYGFSRDGLTKKGTVWWQTGVARIPERLLEEKTEPSTSVSPFALASRNPIGALGFSSRPQAKDIQKRAKEIERLSQIGIDAEYDAVIPYCLQLQDPMAIKEAAEVLINPKKAAEADFFWLDFDDGVSKEKKLADLIVDKRLHAAYFDIRRSRQPRFRRLRFIIALLLLEHEESPAAAKAAATSWNYLSEDTGIFTSYGIEKEYVLDKVVELVSDVAERTHNWDIALEFGRLSGRYPGKYYEVYVTPLVKSVQAASKRVNDNIRVLENAKTNGAKVLSMYVNGLVTSVTQGEQAVKTAKSNPRVPGDYAPMSEAVNEYAQSVRNAAVAIVTTADDVDKDSIALSRSMLKTARAYANTVALKHRIKNDEADLDRLVDEMRYVKKRDKKLELASKALQRGDSKTAMIHLNAARGMARTPQEINQIGQLIAVTRKGMLAKDFEKQLNAGQFRAALNTLDEYISLEDDWSERLKLCQTRDDLAAQVELIERASRNRYRW